MEPNVPVMAESRPNLLERAAIDLECVRQVCLQPFYYVFAGPSGGLLLVAALFGQVSHSVLWRWLVTLVAARLVVRVLAVRYGKQGIGGDRRRRFAYLASEVMQGMVWGSAPIVLRPALSRYEMFPIVILIAVATMTALTMAPFLVAAIAFTLPVAVMLAAWLLHEGGVWGWSAALGSVAIYGMAIYHARQTNLDLKRAVAGRIEIARLAEQLEIARARAEAANTELQARNERLREMARRDPLTGLFNRRHFVEWLDRVRVRDVETRPWFLAILDADHFKRFNDEFGHQVGDQVLIAIANAATGEIRWTDCFARIGGEEFGLLLQDVSKAEAVVIVERVRSAVAAVDLGVGNITLSVGMLTGEQNLDADIALTRADEALYEAKRTGRNKLVCAASLRDVPQISPAST